jgi:hypothetical protein
MNSIKTKHYAQDLPDARRWPNARRALVLWRQEHMDRLMFGSNRDWAEWRDDQALAAACDYHREPINGGKPYGRCSACRVRAHTAPAPGCPGKRPL